MASLIEELLKQQAMSQSQPRGIVQSEVPGGLLAMLSQGNQVSTPDMSGILNAQAPQIQMPEMPTYQGGSGLGKSIIGSLLGEWFDERKATKEATMADEQRKQDIAYLESIGGITDPKERAMALMQSRIRAAADAGKDITVDQFKQPDTEKVKIVEMGVPGHPDLRQQAYYDAATKQLTPIGNPWRPSAGVVVNTGDGTMMRPATDEQKTQWGIDTRVPATFNAKTGEVVAKPTGITEDQGKAGMNVVGLKGAMDSMREVLKTKSMNPNQNKQDYAGDVLQSTGIPIVEDIGNAMKSTDQQKFDQSKSQLITSVVHLLSGQGFSNVEIEEKLKAFIPIWGEDPSVTEQKFKALEEQAKAGTQRAGSAIPADKSPKLDLPPAQPGMVMDGYMFMGGDPAKKENWRKQ